jgi:methionyl-tRNA formyltransferase
MTAYVVAATKPWNRRVFDETIARLPGQWHFLDEPGRLTADHLAAIQPRYVFFLHWSSRIPAEIFQAYECVGFHMSDVPYGRGGSPLQNLIARGHRHTKLSALRVGEVLDGGDVYLKEDLCLEGSAEEVYVRASQLAATMIDRIVRETPAPVPQMGDVVTFKRRQPAESEIPAVADLPRLRDFIRMLDAEGYPRAFLVHHGFRYEFSRVALREGALVADVRITRALGEP